MQDAGPEISAEQHDRGSKAALKTWSIGR